jgi:hypothetical protein
LIDIKRNCLDDQAPATNSLELSIRLNYNKGIANTPKPDHYQAERKEKELN